MANEENNSQSGYMLTDGNKRTGQFLSYYNQLLTQLTQNPYTVNAQIIANPREMQAQTIAAPEKIAAQRIDAGQHTYDEFADQAASYLSKYLDNSIALRRKQTKDARAASDVDAFSRGMGGSTWLNDAKNRLAAQEAADITNMQNNYLGQVGEQAFNSYQNYLNRAFQADLQNAANQLVADQQNAAYEYGTSQFNANALMDTDKFNINNLLQVAMQNAANQYNADVFNAQTLQHISELAWQYAQQMYDLKRKGSGAPKPDDNEDPVTETPSGNDASYGGGAGRPLFMVRD